MSFSIVVGSVLYNAHDDHPLGILANKDEIFQII